MYSHTAFPRHHVGLPLRAYEADKIFPKSECTRVVGKDLGAQIVLAMLAVHVSLDTESASETTNPALERQVSPIVVANADGVSHVVNEDLSVTNLSCARRIHQLTDNFINAFGLYHYF